MEKTVDSFLGGNAPITIQATNGAVIYVTIQTVVRDYQHDSLRWWADLISKAPPVTKKVFVETL